MTEAPTLADAHLRAQTIVGTLLLKYGGDRVRALEAAEEASCYGTSDRSRSVHDAVLALFKLPNDALAALLRSSYDELLALRKFKSFVHTYLDSIGVPSDPFPEENAKHGCRISGRLQWLNERRLTPERADLILRIASALLDGKTADALEAVDTLRNSTAWPTP